MFSDLSAKQQGQSLLRYPVSEDQGPLLERASSTYRGRSERYNVGERSFSRQYAHIYAARLMQMRPLFPRTAQQKWGQQCGRAPPRSFQTPFLTLLLLTGSDVPVKKLCDLQTGERCCIVGTVFKSMDLQPSILKEISDEVSQRSRHSPSLHTSLSNLD